MTARRTSLLPLLRPLRVPALAVGLIGLAIGVLALSLPLYASQLVDRVIVTRSETALTLLVTVALALVTSMAVLDLLRRIVLVRMANRLGLVLEAAIADAPRPPPHVASRFGVRRAAVETLRGAVVGQMGRAGADLVMLPVLLGALVLISPTLAGAAATVIAGIAVLIGASRLVSGPPDACAERLSADAAAAVVEVDVASTCAEAMGFRANLLERPKAALGPIFAYRSQAEDRAAWLAAATFFLAAAGAVAFLALAATLVLQEALSLGLAIGAAILFVMAIAPVAILGSAGERLAAVRLAWSEITAAVDPANAAEEAVFVKVPQGRLEVDAVQVVPPGGTTPILVDVSFTLAPGEALGVLGPSGAGKTALARVLSGLWAPSEGTVKLDGLDVTRWPRETLGRYFGYLPQAATLFDGTIGENIARFTGAKPAAVVEAAKLAGVHEAILKLPLGYGTPVGHLGQALSTGERQRIALARAVFGDPKLVVLDEPHTGLDSDGEHALLELIRHLTERGVTLVVIAHRPVFIRAMSQVVVLKETRLERMASPGDVLPAIVPVAPEQKRAIP